MACRARRVKTTSEENSSILWPSLGRLISGTETLQKGRLVLLPDLDDASFTPCVCSISLNPSWITTISIWQHRPQELAASLVFDIQSSVELIANQEVLNLEQMVGSFASSSLFFSMWKDVISVLDSPFYESSVSLLTGYIDNNLFANNQFEAHFDGHSEDSPHHQSLIHQAMWMADVAIRLMS